MYHVDQSCEVWGHDHYKCECGAEIDTAFYDSAAPLGHDFHDGICSRCGESDPDYIPPQTKTEEVTVSEQRTRTVTKPVETQVDMTRDEFGQACVKYLKEAYKAQLKGTSHIVKTWSFTADDIKNGGLSGALQANDTVDLNWNSTITKPTIRRNTDTFYPIETTTAWYPYAKGILYKEGQPTTKTVVEDQEVEETYYEDVVYLVDYLLVDGEWVETGRVLK